MAATLTLDILTPRGPTRQGLDVAGVEIPGILGELGALPQHETFITAVAPGVVRFKEDGASIRVAVGAGFLEITDDGRAVILVERAVESTDIDLEQAKADLEAATAELAAHKDSIDGAEYQSLEQEQAWLRAQVRAAAG